MPRRSPSSTSPPTKAAVLPVDTVPIDTGTAEVIPDLDHSRRVTLQVNGVPSSYLDLGDPGFLAFEYMQQMDAVVAACTTGPLRALHLGAGGCTLARCWDAARPGSRQLAVDIDARLVTLVRQWFDLPRSPRLRLRADEAGRSLTAAYPGSYDVVVRDVFAGAETPKQLITQEAASAAANALSPGGLYLVNCADRPPLAHVRRELATLALAFGPGAAAEQRLALIAEPGILKGRRYGNLVLAATCPSPAGQEADIPDLAGPALARRLRALPVPAQILTGEDLARFIGTAKPY